MKFNLFKLQKKKKTQLYNFKWQNIRCVCFSWQGGGETVISANAVDGTKAGRFKRSQSKLSVYSQFSVFCLVVSSHVYIYLYQTNYIHCCLFLSFLAHEKNTYTHALLPKNTLFGTI